MDFSCYIHIPYCIQKCSYCDFTTITQNKKPRSLKKGQALPSTKASLKHEKSHKATIPSPSVYTKWVKQEIDLRHQGLKNKKIKSIYFGGGTPSLISPKHINALIEHLKKYFCFMPDIEITIEINPGTLTKKSLNSYLASGVNRFSVGVQTFREDLLKLFNREHSNQQTHNTLELLRENKVSFSADLLFALNHQTLKDLKKDMDIILSYKPQHISAYYLTLPNRHWLQKNRPTEPVQLQMFKQIQERLHKEGFDHYEISNFAKKGFYSQHNLSYWMDKNYWGLGLSAHSFLKHQQKRVRFWNPKNLKLYAKQVENVSKPYPFSALPKEQKEDLTLPEALTDFCHTALRTRFGISIKKVKKTFGKKASDIVYKKIKHLKEKLLIKHVGDSYRLTPSLWLISNHIFEELTFLDKDF